METTKNELFDEVIETGARFFEYTDKKGVKRRFDLRTERDYNDLARVIKRINKSHLKEKCITLANALYVYLGGLREKRQMAGLFCVEKIFNRDLITKLANKESNIIQYIPIDRNDKPVYCSVLKAELKNFFAELRKIQRAGFWKAEILKNGMEISIKYNGLQTTDKALDLLYEKFLMQNGIS